MIFDGAKRPSAKELLEHPFLHKAAKPGYIVEHLLSHLPPLDERCARLRSDFPIEEPSINVSGSCPVPVQWSFLDEWESAHREQKGRFTITRSPPRPGPTSLLNPEQGEKEKVRETAGGDPDARVAELERRVAALTEENQEMRKQLGLLTDLVMKLAGEQ
jgi:hypothetical protein